MAETWQRHRDTRQEALKETHKSEDSGVDKYETRDESRDWLFMFVLIDDEIFLSRLC